MSKLIVSPRPTLSKLNTIDGIAPGETAKVRLHNGPRYEIAASALRIRFSLTVVEIFNAKGKDIVIAQRFRFVDSELPESVTLRI